MSNKSAVPKPTLKPTHRYFSAIVSQGIVSAFHFGLNLGLVQYLSKGGYGVFALAFVVAIMASAVSNALVGAPLAVFGPASTTQIDRARIEAVLNSAMALLLGGAVFVGLVAVGVGTARGSELMAGFALLFFVITFLARYHSRSLGYARFEVISVLHADLLYVTTSAVGLFVVLVSGATATVTTVLTVLGLGNLAAASFQAVRTTPRPGLVGRNEFRRGYQPIWQQSKWALVGAVTTMLVSQAHSVVVSVALGPQAFAPLAAGFVVFGPVRVLFFAIQNVMRPEMALAVSEENPSAIRQAMVASILSAAAVSALAIAMFIAWPTLDSWLYDAKYGAEPMGTIVALWALVAFMSAIQTGPSALLQALKRFRPLAMTTVWGSALSLSLVSLAVYQRPLHRSILAIAISEAFVAIGLVILVRRDRATAFSRQAA